MDRRHSLVRHVACVAVLLLAASGCGHTEARCESGYRDDGNGFCLPDRDGSSSPDAGLDPPAVDAGPWVRHPLPVPAAPLSLRSVALAVSADATRIAAATTYTDSTWDSRYEAPYRIFTSSDAGASWTQQGDVGDWGAIASSADGTTLIAANADTMSAGGFLYVSHDSGSTWTQRGSGQRWMAVASSADGRKLVAATIGEYNSGGGYLYTSDDSGATWTQRGPRQDWTAVASSADGTRLIAVGSIGTTSVPDGSGTGNQIYTPYGGYIYTSVDSGVTWTRHGTPHGWEAVASSADGQTLIAADGGERNNGAVCCHGPVSPAYLYLSRDAGATWTQQAVQAYWTSVAASADGKTLLASTWDAVHVSFDAGATWGQQAIPTTTGMASTQSVALSADGATLVVATREAVLTLSP